MTSNAACGPDCHAHPYPHTHPTPGEVEPLADWEREMTQHAALTQTLRTYYGVSHDNTHDRYIAQYDTRQDAEDRLRECIEDGADCYLIRIMVGWERVPDGE